MTLAIYYKKHLNSVHDKLLFRATGFLFVIALSAVNLNAQTTNRYNVVTYVYSVIGTPYGDYFGKIVLTKERKQHKGELLDDEGEIYRLKIHKLTDKQLIFTTYIEKTRTIFYCRLVGDSIKGNIKFKADDFKYVLKGVKLEKY